MQKNCCTLAVLLLVVALTSAQMQGQRRPSLVFARNRAQAELEAANVVMSSKPETEAAVNLRNTGKLRTVENQGQCGSCALFSTTHAFQDYFLIKGCSFSKVSEQDLLDCVSGTCSTGWYPGAIWTRIQNKGATHTACKPYKTAKMACTTTCASGAAETWHAGHTAYTCTTSATTVVDWLNAHYPVQFAIDVYHNIYNFGSSSVATSQVYSGGGSSLGGHSMEIVGYGTLNGVNYWHVKNSWGSTWGNGGFFMVKRGIGNPGTYGGYCRANAATTCPSIFSEDPAEPAFKMEAVVPADPITDDAALMSSYSYPAPDGGASLENSSFPANGGPGQPVPFTDLSDPLLIEAAQFSVRVLLSTPTTEGGYGCLAALPEVTYENVTGEIMNSTDLEADPVIGSTQITMYTAQAAVVAGGAYQFIFGFTNKLPQCASSNPGGVYQATVFLTQDGYLIMDSVFPTNPPPEGSKINVAAVVGGSVAAFVVVAAIGIAFGIRYRRNRNNYKKLQETYQEVVRRVTILESGPAGAAVREAALSKLLLEGADPETRAASGEKRPSGPAVRWHDKRPSSKANLNTGITTSSV